MKVSRNVTERQVTKTYVETIEDEVFTLELTREEAIMLLAVSGSVSGYVATNSIRSLTDRLYSELKDTLDVEWDSPAIVKYTDNIISMRVGRQ